jgi:hypothetical protein
MRVQILPAVYVRILEKERKGGCRVTILCVCVCVCVCVCIAFQILKKPTDLNEIWCILNVIKNLKLFKLYRTYYGILGNKMLTA